MECLDDDDRDGATAYLIYRIDCQECGDVTDTDSGDEPPTVCPNDACGAPVTVS